MRLFSFSFLLPFSSSFIFTLLFASLPSRPVYSDTEFTNFESEKNRIQSIAKLLENSCPQNETGVNESKAQRIYTIYEEADQIAKKAVNYHNSTFSQFKLAQTQPNLDFRNHLLKQQRSLASLKNTLADKLQDAEFSHDEIEVRKMKKQMVQLLNHERKIQDAAEIAKTHSDFVPAEFSQSNDQKKTTLLTETNQWREISIQADNLKRKAYNCYGFAAGKMLYVSDDVLININPNQKTKTISEQSTSEPVSPSENREAGGASPQRSPGSKKGAGQAL